MPSQSERPRDLAIGVAAALVAGFLVGVLGTVKHHFGVSAVTGAGWPVGLAASLAMVALLLAALRLAFGTRWLALAAAVGVVAAVGVLLLPGPGGSRIVLLDWPGIVWTVGTPVLGVAAVAWPARRRAPVEQRPDGILDADRPEGVA